MLAGQFRDGVGAERSRRHCLALGQRGRVAVGRAAGGIDHAFDARFFRGHEDIERAGRVGVVTVARLVDAERHAGDRAEVQDDFGALGGALADGRVANIAFDQLELRGDVGDVLAVARAEIVQHARLVPQTKQPVNDMAADESRTAGDQNHAHDLSLQRPKNPSALCVVRAARSSNETPRSSARNRAVCSTNAGSFGRVLRTGSGDI